MHRTSTAEHSRVLVVSADAVYQAILRRTAERVGFETVSATSAAEAWSIVSDDPVDIVVYDTNVADVPTRDFLSRVRALGSHQYVYLVFLSNQPYLESEELVSLGADDVLPSPVDSRMLEVRLRVAQRVIAMHRGLYHEARTDPLTQLGNRARFNEDIEQLLERCWRYDEPFVVAVCDVDRFKPYNDTLGHLAGDKALKGVSRALEESLRRSDNLYRFGGEEFLVVLARQELDGARLAADRIRHRVASARIAHDGNPPWNVVTISIGVAMHPGRSHRPIEDTIQQADEALYRAKDGGRNCVMAHGDTNPTRLLETPLGRTAANDDEAAAGLSEATKPGDESAA